jgi:hypothetical protein
MKGALATMTASPAETTAVHTRLLKCALCIEETRAYWAESAASDARPSAQLAFEQNWFGNKSERWIEVLLTNMRARFDAFPDALWVLRRWRHMPPETRALICHWHLQLTDPMYRAFTGGYLLERREALRPEVSRNGAIRWVGDQGPGRWTMATRTQLASRLLSCALSAGLVRGRRDPRELLQPRVPDEALGYLLHLLRGVSFQGSLVDNPYLASVGLVGGLVADRLRALPGVRYRRVGDVHDFDWADADLRAWAAANVLVPLT